MHTNNEAYEEWIKIFDSDVCVIWNKERRELQRVAMLLGALQKEFKRVHTMVDSEYSILRQQLEEKDLLEEETKSACWDKSSKSRNSANKENKSVSNKMTVRNGSDIESPDLFRNIETNKDLESNSTMNSTIIDLSLSDDDKTALVKSPTLVSKHRKQKLKRLRGPKPDLESNDYSTPGCVHKNILQTRKLNNMDSSIIIDCTPDMKMKKSDSRFGQFLSKKKAHRSRNTSTLTQMFASTSKPKLVKSQKAGECIDSDETCIDSNESKSKLSITDLLRYINEDENEKNVPEDFDESEMEEMDSMQELDQFSKGAFLDESLGAESSPKKPKIIEPEPIVRGHARKLLNGFACKDCHDFYAHMNLPPEELQKKMDECSKHRYTYKPPQDTLPGLWDMTIPSQN